MSTSTVPAPVRLAERDHSQVARLFRQAPRTHLHLDWRTLDAWLGSPALRCWVLREGGHPHALLGATLHQPPGERKVAWLRMMVPAVMGRDPALDMLWETLREDLRAEGVGQIALMALDDWAARQVEGWGFEHTNAVVTLRRFGTDMPPEPDARYTLREIATYADLDAVAALDARAFAPLWQYSRETLLVAQQHAATFTVLEEDGMVVGYQLSTWHAGSGHLARLAVEPARQGEGLAKILINGVIRYLEARNTHVLTVNTQEDNIRSQRLYRRMGFERTGHDAPVWTLNL